MCRKKRSLRTNSFFEKYPKIPLGDLILLIYFWSQDEQRRRAARMLSLNENLVCRVFRSLEDICSADIERNPFIPFPGRAVVKCDESKFSHKAKVGFSVFDCETNYLLPRSKRPINFNLVLMQVVSSV